MGPWDNFDSVDGTIVEDSCHLKFVKKRPLKYLHPRTTMLFMGPKNVPVTQVHFVFASPSNASNDVITDETSSFVVLIMSVFEGVPMADYFKVLQYWTFYEIEDATSKKVEAVVGANVFYSKQTIFRSQISSGVKDELLSLSKQWMIHTNHLLSKPQITIDDVLISQKNRLSGRLSSDSDNVRSLKSSVTPRKEVSQKMIANTSVMNEVGWGIALVLFMIVIYQFYSQWSLSNKLQEITSLLNKLDTKLSKIKYL
jgi:hypothetical protein